MIRLVFFRIRTLWSSWRDSSCCSSNEPLLNNQILLFCKRYQTYHFYIKKKKISILIEENLRASFNGKNLNYNNKKKDQQLNITKKDFCLKLMVMTLQSGICFTEMICPVLSINRRFQSAEDGPQWDLQLKLHGVEFL